MTVQTLISEKGSQVCCGCTACLSVCPKQCISMKQDKEGFLYPTVDENLCINCESCVKTCPFHAPYDSHKPIATYAAYNKDETVRMQSSSGGVFSLLATKIIQEGGVVFGAKYTSDWQVEIVPAKTMDELEAFRGSKYFQANVGTSFRQAKQYLKEDRKVLFSGTPCQVAGLRHYLRRDYDNLLCVDFVCHGVPSPKVWNLYLREVTEADRKVVKDVKFRDKPNGWKRYNFTLDYQEDDKEYSISSYNGENHFMRAFLSDMILRLSCYSCQAKSGRSHSDITIGDYWGINNVHPEMDDDKGTSLIMIHTDKGVDYLNLSQLVYTKSTYESGLRHNPAIEGSAVEHRHRLDFFDRIDSSESLIALIDKELKPTFKQCLRKKYRGLKHRAKSLVGHILSVHSR